MATTANGYSDDFGPNVADILKHGMRVIRAPIPARVRKDLSAAVKAGVLGHLRKDGLKPEIFFHPSHKNSAVERQKREATHSVNCIAGVVASPSDVREGLERAGVDVLGYALAERKIAGLSA